VSTNYYVRTNQCRAACEHCTGELLHLGKFSAGWAFSFRGEPEWFEHNGSNAFWHWYDRVGGGAIESEYGTPVSTADFLFDVMQSHTTPLHKSHALEYPGPDTRMVGPFSFTLCEFQ
jgi:hypothetical protein